MNKNTRHLLSRWLPVFLWAGIIFILSNDTNPYSHIPNLFYSWLWWTKLFGQSLIFYLGGAAHFFEYAVLSILVARAMLWEGNYSRGRLFTVYYLTLLFAFTDEFHQLFTPGRAFQLVDLLLDAFGALLGLGLYLLWARREEVKQSEFIKSVKGLPLKLKNLLTKTT